MPGAATDRHGPLHDRFGAQSSEPHGPLYDDFDNPQAGVDTHGKLFDQFETRPGVDRYGDFKFDEFGWHDMPAKHGQRFDSDFGQPTALDNGTGHGTWNDVFRDGAHVRWVAGGSDYEGTVTGGGREHRICEDHTGERHEVGLGQILQWREASAAATLGDDKPKPTADPGNTPTSPVDGPQGQRPSGASATARGNGGRTPVDPGLVDATFANKLDDAIDLDEVAKTTATVMPRKDTAVPEGAVEQHRANLHALASSDHKALKTIACPGCQKTDTYHIGHVPLVAKNGQVKSKMYGVCKGKGACGFTHSFPPPKLAAAAVGKTLLIAAGCPEDVLKALCTNCDPTELANQPVVHIDARCERCGGTIVPSAEHADGSNPDRSERAEHKVPGTERQVAVAGKTDDEDLDVEKGLHGAKGGYPEGAFKVPGSDHGPFCMGCAKTHARSIGSAVIAPAKVGEGRRGSGHRGCPGCATPIGTHAAYRPGVAKSVDASETATQTQGSAGEHNAWCPHCKHTCRRASDGKCPTCGGKVRDKDAEKARESDADVLKGLADLAGVS